jgi:hypothetical protein
MAIDKELYRQAYEYYRQWNEAEKIERARNAGKLTPQQGWEQYVELWQFLVNTGEEPSERQQQKRLADWAEYYARLQKFKAWRREHGKTT